MRASTVIIVIVCVLFFVGIAFAYSLEDQTQLCHLTCLP